MSGWAGFSEEELRKLQQKDSVMSSAVARARKQAPAGRSRQQLQRERALQLAAQTQPGASYPRLSPDQQLTKPLPSDEPGPEPGPKPGPEPGPKPAAAPAAPAVRQELQQKRPELKPADSPQPAAEDHSPAVKELEKQEVELREKTRLELLQQEQRMIEERNKRKKALLAKTIAEKSKQTQAEAVKLKRIQRELQALDDMVSNDIGILRSKIEQASWDYSAARKRYEKAETEYVSAKLALHKKTEVKEQLTEHLCAIIQQNEMRKAHKLEELMQQLQLQATEEELERQREEEEKEKEEEVKENKQRSCVEMQRDGKQGNGSVESQEGTVQSTKDCGPTEQESVEEERRGDLHKEHHSMIEPPKTQQDCNTQENNVQSEAVAS